MSPLTFWIIVLIILLVIVMLTLELPRYYSLKSNFVDVALHEQMFIKSKYVPKAEGRTVISLTSTPDRIGLIGPTIVSLFEQTLRVDEIALNIPLVSRKGISYDIPKWLQESTVVKIHRVEKDLGPATKVLPTLQREDAGTKIIVVDDDVIYHSNTVRALVSAYESRQNQYEDQFNKVHTRSAYTNYGIRLRNGRLPTNTKRVWNFFTRSRKVDLLQGFSGFIVTPDMFPKDVFDQQAGPPEAISVDDIWLSGWLKHNGIDIRSVGGTFLQLPLVNMGKMRSTVSLGGSENQGFITDMKVIEWFRDKYNVW